jgi:NAD-dependent SIR2 family protein deacetylase
MKSNFLKIFAITSIMVFIGAGVSLADGLKDESGHRNHAYGHYKHRVHHHYHHHYAPPRPVYVEHRYRPVVVERYYDPAPVRYVAPAPSGFFFGMSVADAGSAFSFGVSGR